MDQIRGKPRAHLKVIDGTLRPVFAPPTDQTKDTGGRVTTLDTLAALRATVDQDFTQSRNWIDLQARLIRKGVTLRREGEELWLLTHPDGAPLTPISAIGYSHGRLRERFGMGFPLLPKRRRDWRNQSFPE